MAATDDLTRIVRRTVHVPPLDLDGVLRLPENARGIVVFAHGSGSGRFSPRNNYVADALGEGRIGTLLFDLLTDEEAADRANVFDINLLAERLLQAVNWVKTRRVTQHHQVGLFGASTGAAAALVAASGIRDVVAVVSRGGRPDLAKPVLHRVNAPTLLIVGGLDTAVLDLNRSALAELRCEKRLEVVPGASHLFEEPGTLDLVVALSRRWFEDHLGGPAPQ